MAQSLRSTGGPTLQRNGPALEIKERRSSPGQWRSKRDGLTPAGGGGRKTNFPIGWLESSPASRLGRRRWYPPSRKVGCGPPAHLTSYKTMQYSTVQFTGGTQRDYTQTTPSAPFYTLRERDFTLTSPSTPLNTAQHRSTPSTPGRPETEDRQT